MLTRTPFPFLPVLCDFWRATPWQSAARDTSLSLCPSALLDRHEKNGTAELVVGLSASGSQAIFWLL